MDTAKASSILTNMSMKDFCPTDRMVWLQAATSTKPSGIEINGINGLIPRSK